MRNAEITRTTTETDIRAALTLEGAGKSDIATGCGFLDHMLTLFSLHGRFDIALSCKGDMQVDAHHTTEDVAIALGQAFSQALSDKRGIARYGQSLLPMDESLVLCAVDLSGRACACVDLPIPAQKCGDFDTELVAEFFAALCRAMHMTLHVKLLAGGNSHHIIEAAFKALGRALRQAVAIEPAFADSLPSTKGAL